ncbi:FixH family protein [Tsuneonella sp. HG249]
MTRRFTGWHMTAIMVAFFAVVIAVNLTMARFAITTFGGVTVENSYVASQKFNRWLDEAAAEKALGWSAEARRGSDGRVVLVLDGPPTSAVITGEARHPLGRLPSRRLTFVAGKSGLRSVESLPADRWTVRVSAIGEGYRWRSEIPLS